MGNYIVKKGILLDERDFEIGPHSTLGGLAEMVDDYLENEFGNVDPEMDDTMPSLEIYGIVSERFDASEIYDSYQMCWISPAGGFRAALLEECKRLGLPNPEVLLDRSETDPEAVEEGLRTAVCSAVMAGNYHDAKRLLSAAVGVRDGQSPFLGNQDYFSKDGDESICDFRDQLHPRGTRILAEIGFNWGQ